MDDFKKEAASYSQNYFEYLIESKGNAGTLIKKLFIVALALVILVVGGYFTLRYLPALGVILFFAIGFGIWYLWRFVSVEYEYVIAQGEIEMEAIYGKRQRKKIMTAKIREMELIAPAEQRYLDQVKRNEPAKTINASISLDDPNTYFCIYNDKKSGVKTMMYFSATKKAVSIFRYYNPGATVVSDNLTL